MEKKFNHERLNLLFSEDSAKGTYVEFKNLMSDLMDGEIQEGTSKREAEEAVRSVVFDLFEVTASDLDKPRVWRHAVEKHTKEYFELIEEVIEEKLDSSLANSELIREFAEVRNLNDGDKNEFWLEEETVLSVGRVSGDHHDLSIQYFKKPTRFTLPMQRYGIKIGDDIRQYLLGRKNFANQISAVAKAFEEKLATTIIGEIANVGDKVPANDDMNISVTISAGSDATQKDTARNAIIDVIGKVRDINGGSNVVMMGTRNAIAKLEAIQDLDWLSSDAKNEKYHTGRIGYFDEATLISVPQKYVKDNKALKNLIPEDFLLVIPTNAEKFVKIVNSGDVFTKTVNEEAATMDDMQTYEMQKSYGVATVVGQYIGYIKLNA